MSVSKIRMISTSAQGNKQSGTLVLENGMINIQNSLCAEGVVSGEYCIAEN